MKIYNITVKREIIDLTEDDSDEEKQSDNTVDTGEENGRSNDKKRCRNENLGQRSVWGLQTGESRIIAKRMNVYDVKMVNVRRYGG